MYSRFNDRIVMYMHTRVIYEKKVHRFLFPCAFDKGEIAIINNVVRILCFCFLTEIGTIEVVERIEQ